MASPAKQPQKKGWGSLLNSAVAGLESRLDTILADDNEASSRQRAAEDTLKKGQTIPRGDSGSLNVPSTRDSAQGSRETSRTRVNDRLAERLAKATAAKATSQAGSGAPSRTATPVNDISARTSDESARSGDAPRSVPDVGEKQDARSEAVASERKEHGQDDAQAKPAENGTLLASSLPMNPARQSMDSSRPSMEISSQDPSARTSSDVPNGTSSSHKSPMELEAEMEQMRQDYATNEKQRQDEMHAYLEKIDALQAKLQYLARETVAAAKEANASTSAGNDEARLAEKDERIALLMEEGEQLSKSELRHMQTIKKLRGKATDDEKAATEFRKKFERAERAESDLKQRLRRAEAADRQASEKLKQIATNDKQVEELRIDRENASELIRRLTTQLKEANEKASAAEKAANVRAAEVDKNRIDGLENELEDAQIEKKLADDRAVAETSKLREEADRHRERFALVELELKNEVTALESRLEAMRSRAEEASSEHSGNESSVKLMRQVETLQSQYSLAKENWETIEGSLNSRVAALEKERDDANRREAEVRKKARDVGLRARKAEDELETAAEQNRSLRQEVERQQDEIGLLERRLEQMASSTEEVRLDAEHQRKLWNTEMQQRIEEEKARWRSASVSSHAQATASRNDLPATPARKTSSAEVTSHLPGRKAMNRTASHDLAALHSPNEAQQRPTSGRSSAFPTPVQSTFSRATPSEASPAISRQESTVSFDTPASAGIPPTPSIEIEPDFEGSNSPQRTINDLVSTSTAGAGPSVQLVERMSAAVRRLESEKASFKDEIARLSSQRDEARNEVVNLMREVDGKRSDEKRVGKMEGDLKEVKQRYDASLEMLGEREEEVQELKQDVLELKKMYRELVEEKVGGGK